MAACPKCGFSLDRPPKTSPENRLFHALVAKLAMWQHVPAEAMKRYVKLYAASVHDYACEQTTIAGKLRIEPKSIAKATKDDMEKKLIPTCYELAMDWGCPMEQDEGI